MDPFTIATTALSLAGTITKVSLTVNTFVRTVREARNDLDAVSRELLSLKTVLELLADDANHAPSDKPIPPNLEKQIKGIINNCDGVVNDVAALLRKHEGGIVNGIKWAISGKDDVVRLRSNLEAHKTALELALDMVALTVMRDMRNDIEDIGNSTAIIKDDTTAIKEDTSLIPRILAEIAQLQAKLPDHVVNVNHSGFILQRYLDELTSYAETVCASSRRSSLEISNTPELESHQEDERKGELTVPEIVGYEEIEKETHMSISTQNRRVTFSNLDEGLVHGDNEEQPDKVYQGDQEIPNQTKQINSSVENQRYTIVPGELNEVKDQRKRPDLQHIIKDFNSLSNKLYHEGYFLILHDLDKGQPTSDRMWKEIFAQLVGTVLSIWDASELDRAGDDHVVTPSFINLREFLEVAGDKKALPNVLIISSTYNNRYFLHFSSLDHLTRWSASIRLAQFEYMTLQEAYTGSVVLSEGTTLEEASSSSMVAGKGKDKLLNTIRTIFNAKPKYEGWAFVRFGAGAPWKRCRFVVTPSDEKRFPIRTDQSETMRSMPKGDLKFYHTMNSKKTQIFASITDAWAAYAIYPEAKSLLKQSTLIVIEGRITIHSNSEGSTEGFVFIMPEIPPAVPALETMLRLLFSVWDTFGLYSRPNNSVDETLDSLSSMCVMSNDRIYRCLKLADVCGLVQIQSSNPWNEERWRREMKSLTVKHMAHANHSDV